MRIVAGMLWVLMLSLGVISDAVATTDDIGADIINTRVLVEGRKNPVIVKLYYRDTGKPVLVEDLEETLSLQVIDLAYEDYHKVMAMPMGHAGEYIFTITPHTDCTYKVWAHIDTKNLAPREVFMPLQGVQNCMKASQDQLPVTEYKGEGYHFTLDVGNEGLTVGKESLVTFVVQESKGAYSRNLQSVRGAYAHMTGFYERDDMIMMLSSEEGDGDSRKKTGGPRVTFRVTPEYTGVIHFFAQIVVDGVLKTASFRIPVRDEVKSEFDDEEFYNDDETLMDILAEENFDPESSETDEEFRKRLLQQSIERKESKKKDDDSLGRLFLEEEEDQDFNLYENPDKKILKRERAVKSP